MQQEVRAAQAKNVAKTRMTGKIEIDWIVGTRFFHSFTSFFDANFPKLNFIKSVQFPKLEECKSVGRHVYIVEIVVAKS